MAIVQMTKVMIVSHRSEASELLEALQREGICQILNAEEAMVSKDYPDLATAGARPKDIEDLLNRLTKAADFLKRYAEPAKGLAGIFSPRTVIDEKSYNEAVQHSEEIVNIVHECEQVEAAIENARAESENLTATLQTLEPWSALETPIEEIGPLKTTTCWAGLIPHRQFQHIQANIGELGGAVQQVGTTPNKYACLIASLNTTVTDVQKLLRSVEFEPVNFESMTGTVAELIKQRREKLNQAQASLRSQYDKAAALSENLLELQILYDHYQNLLSREQARHTAPASEYTVILEGWAKRTDFPRLRRIVSRFPASSLSKIEPAKDEDIPVEIENKNIVRPFEVITRLYGMPKHFEVDPTVFLAPFFALFFAVCLTDAGYGLVIIALMLFFIKKIQGDKKLMWMLGICSLVTIVAGALTGGWFGDAIQQFVPALKPLRAKMMWFDPFEKPMMFFGVALALGYLQLMTGLVIAFVHNLKRRDYVAALCNQLTWLLMLNSLVIFGFSKAGVVAAGLGSFFGKLATVPAVAIVLFSQRQGSWAARLGMGAYNLFTAIFYIGDVLSYLRLMALGMVTAGLAMAINVIAKIALSIPYHLGIFVTILVLVGGHAFNMSINALGAFVHTLRLQYVEFFPKFFIGGGRVFQPLSKQYRHIYITKQGSI